MPPGVKKKDWTVMRCEECGILVTQTHNEIVFSPKSCRPCRQRILKGRAKTLKRAESLWAKNQAFASSWVQSRNFGLTPEDVSLKSQTKRFFRCSVCSAGIYASPGNLTRAIAVLCQPCARLSTGTKNAVPKGLSVAEVPKLMAIWDSELNAENPSLVAAQSNKKFFWLCSKEHSTFTQACNRFAGRGCAICLEKYFVSGPERELRDFIATIYQGPAEFNRKKYTTPYELDLVLPSLGLAIEFNGSYYHSDTMILQNKGMTSKEYHSMKFDRAKAAGLHLLFVWEHDWKGRKTEVEVALKRAISLSEYHPILGKIAT